MKTKNILSILFILCAGLSYSQLYVGGISNIYVADRFVYVKKALNLNSNAHFFLRNESQLLQGTSSTGNNSGNGALSVFQEGTVNQYKYNYWCAPVGDYSNSGGNGSFWIDQFYAPQTNTQSTQANIIEDDYDGVSNPLGIATFWIYKYLQEAYYEGYSFAGSNNKMKAGEGFTMKGTGGTDNTTVIGVKNNPDGSHQRYDFRGRPNDGTIDIYVEDGMFTLTGNPYPSAIDLSAFLTDAANCTGIAYFWEQSKGDANTHELASYIGGFGSFSPVSRGGTGIYVPAEYYMRDPEFPNVEIYIYVTGNYFERRFSPIGQGFMIQGNSSGNIVQMKNSYRVYKKEGVANLSQFDRNANHRPVEEKIQSVSGFDYTKVSKEAVPQIRLKIEMNNEKVRELALAFDDNATNGEDHAMDARLFKADYTSVPYFVLNRDEEFVIDVMPFDIKAKIPFGFKNKEKTQYKITVKEVLNFDRAENIYLHDKKTGRYYDLQKGFCELTLPPGTNNTDFEITFINEGNQLANTPFIAAKFTVLQDNIRKMLLLSNENQIGVTKIELFDAAGKLAYSQKYPDIKALYEIPTSNLANGIYIARISGEGNVVQSKKISIKN